MRWGFRVATDRRFGAGHFARSRALASALNTDPVLYCDPDNAIVSDWPCFVVCETAADRADAALSALRQQTIQGLVFDTYAVSDSVITNVAREGFVAAFRDSSSRGPETISINPNPGQPASSSSLNGPEYMPLPAAFAERNEVARRIAKAPSVPLAVLIAFGAYDGANRTMTALQGLVEHSSHLRVSVALGPNAIHLADVATAVASLNGFEMQANGNLADAFANFDIAIGAPGVSQFERACSGLPSVLVAQNDRQQPLARAWADTGAARFCDAKAEAVSSAVGALLSNQRKILQMRERGLSLVDGKGAARLAAALKQRAAA